MSRDLLSLCDVESQSFRYFNTRARNTSRMWATLKRWKSSSHDDSQRVVEFVDSTNSRSVSIAIEGICFIAKPNKAGAALVARKRYFFENPNTHRDRSTDRTAHRKKKQGRERGIRETVRLCSSAEQRE